MKKIIITLAILAISFNAFAADIIVSITIPDAYTSRLINMVNTQYMDSGECEGLTIKQCFTKKMITEPIKEELLIFEKYKARKDAADAASANIHEIEIVE